MENSGETYTFQIICNEDSSIQKILCDDGSFFAAPIERTALDSIIPITSRKKFMAFTDEVINRGFGFCRRISLQGKPGTFSFVLIGVKRKSELHISGIQIVEHLTIFFEDFVKIINDQSVMLRQSQKKSADNFNMGEANEENLLNDYMAVNNELANMQRELTKEHSLLEAAYKKIETISTTDSLTGVANRRFILSTLREEITRSVRYRIPLSVLSLDLDFFKRINDQYGHSGGDRVLIAFTQICQSQLRESDILGRIGGEEFMIILPHTDLDKAIVTATRICKKVEKAVVEYNTASIRITVSAGVGSLAPGEEMEELLQRVDVALYEAKKNGRNRVTKSSPQPLS